MNENIRKREQINNILWELNQNINFLYEAPCIIVKNLMLSNIRNQLAILARLNGELNLLDIFPQVLNKGQRDFTPEQLSMYDGKDGNPAYIAVDGVVYDVTDNAAWAAASHFGLTAGKDLSGPFNSCHSGQQQILSRLKVVGKLL